jgi:hypothetical protein
MKVADSYQRTSLLQCDIYYCSQKTDQKLQDNNTQTKSCSQCGLYYKHITSVNDDSSVVSKWRHSLEHHLLMSSFMIVIVYNTGHW